MVGQVRVAVLGVIENMSYLVGPGTGQRMDVFGHGGGKRTAEQMGVPFLGELALDRDVRIGGDSGQPVTTRGDTDAHATPFYDLARNIEERCGQSQSKAPTVTVE